MCSPPTHWMCFLLLIVLLVKWSSDVGFIRTNALFFLFFFFAETTSWCWMCSLRLWTTRPSSKRKLTKWQVCWVCIDLPVYVSHSFWMCRCVGKRPTLTHEIIQRLDGHQTYWCQAINKMSALGIVVNSVAARQINKWNKQQLASAQALTEHRGLLLSLVLILTI